MKSLTYEMPNGKEINYLATHKFCCCYNNDLRKHAGFYYGTNIHGQDTLLSQCLSPPRSINGYQQTVRETRQNAGRLPAMD